MGRFLDELQSLAKGFVPDEVIYNTHHSVSQSLQNIIDKEGGELVTLGDVSAFNNCNFTGRDIISSDTGSRQSKVDTVKRILLRHDAKKVLQLLGLG